MSAGFGLIIIQLICNSFSLTVVLRSCQLALWCPLLAAVSFSRWLHVTLLPYPPRLSAGPPPSSPPPIRTGHSGRHLGQTPASLALRVQQRNNRGEMLEICERGDGYLILQKILPPKKITVLFVWYFSVARFQNANKRKSLFIALTSRLSVWKRRSLPSSCLPSVQKPSKHKTRILERQRWAKRLPIRWNWRRRRRAQPQPKRFVYNPKSQAPVSPQLP